MGATIAACRGDASYLGTLIARGTNLNVAGSENRWTPLHYACGRGHLDTTKLLILSGRVDLNARTRDGSTALVLASQHGWRDVVRWLLVAGASRDVADEEGRTAVFMSCHESYDKILISLLANGADMGRPDRSGLSPLHIAAWKGHVKCVSILLHAKVCVDVSTYASGTTPLHIATWKNRKRCVRRLIAAGANVNRVDGSGRTALLVACWKGWVDVAAILVHSGARIAYRDLELADSSGWERSRELLHLLLGRANCPPVKTNWACRANRTNLLRVLLEKGAVLSKELVDACRRRRMPRARTTRLAEVEEAGNAVAPPPPPSHPSTTTALFAADHERFSIRVCDIVLEASRRRRVQTDVARRLVHFFDVRDVVVAAARVVDGEGRSMRGTRAPPCDAACVERCERCKWMRNAHSCEDKPEYADREKRPVRIPSHVLSCVFGKGGFLPLAALWLAKTPSPVVE
eukprot:g3557.t1